MYLVSCVVNCLMRLEFAWKDIRRFRNENKSLTMFRQVTKLVIRYTAWLCSALLCEPKVIAPHCPLFERTVPLLEQFYRTKSFILLQNYCICYFEKYVAVKKVLDSMDATELPPTQSMQKLACNIYPHMPNCAPSPDFSIKINGATISPFPYASVLGVILGSPLAPHPITIQILPLNPCKVS